MDMEPYCLRLCFPERNELLSQVFSGDKCSTTKKHSRSRTNWAIQRVQPGVLPDEQVLLKLHQMLEKVKLPACNRAVPDHLHYKCFLS